MTSGQLGKLVVGTMGMITIAVVAAFEGVCGI